MRKGITATDNEESYFDSRKSRKARQVGGGRSRSSTTTDSANPVRDSPPTRPLPLCLLLRVRWDVYTYVFRPIQPPYICCANDEDQPNFPGSMYCQPGSPNLSLSGLFSLSFPDHLPPSKEMKGESSPFWKICFSLPVPFTCDRVHNTFGTCSHMIRRNCVPERNRLRWAAWSSVPYRDG